MRHYFTIGLILLLSGCASARQFASNSLSPFGNPNAPVANSETAQRALGQHSAVSPLQPQAGDVWPGPQQAMPTLSQIQHDANANLPVGTAYQPSLPSPYPPGQGPAPGSDNADLGTSLYATLPSGAKAVVPAVPGDAR